MSTSDDKKILVWECNTPVPLKQIHEDGMQNIPTLTMHPSHNAIAGQSMDNTIVVYACSETVCICVCINHIMYIYLNYGCVCNRLSH